MDTLAFILISLSGWVVGLAVFVVATSLPELRQWLLKRGYNQAFQEQDQHILHIEQQVERLQKRLSVLERTLQAHVVHDTIKDVEKDIAERFGDASCKREA